MKLYIYRGLENEKVPKDVTHVIVASSVTVIRKEAFFECKLLVSVIMGGNVQRIEAHAFYGCCALRFVRLSRTLEYIGRMAFHSCYSLEALFLPSTLKSIGYQAFYVCRSLRLLILPNDIDLDNVGEGIINETVIYQIAKNAGVEYERASVVTNFGYRITEESIRRVNEWLIHHMDEAPFHKLCYNSSIATKHLNDCLNEHDTDSALVIDTFHGMTPLHMLSMNPQHSPADAMMLTWRSSFAWIIEERFRWTMQEIAMLVD